MMKVKMFTTGPLSTNAYLVVCEETNKGAIIDPSPGSAALFKKEAEEVEISKILITHSHWDHIADCKELADYFKVPVYLHKDDVENLRHPGTDGLPYELDRPIPGMEPEGFLEDGDRVEIGNLTFEVLHTPGHAPGLVCFYEEGEKALFCGDLFFQGAIGWLHLPTAEPERMWPSLQRIASLPPETKVYPGHRGPTQVGKEPWLAEAEELYRDQ